MKRVCEICDQEFNSSANNQKFCSDGCRLKNGRLKEKKRYAESLINSRKTTTCKACNKTFDYHFRPERGDRVFCGRSCASKYYIQQGDFDSWRLRSNPRQGEQKKCLNIACNNFVYLEPRLVKLNKGKVCSFECEKAYFSQLFLGKNNPFYGKKLSEESKIKQKTTLQTNYPGTTNAFNLSKKRIKTRPQIAIFDYVNSKYSNFQFEIEKRITKQDKEYFGDIVSFHKKLLIEFNGDYWHCNPEKYSPDFYHHVKKIPASDIWYQDKKRLETITSFGYRIVVIWESEYKDGSWKDKLDRWLEENAKKDNINVIRPSVNNHSSADVKLGELLESHGTNTTT
jgi:G:T-mismatch repair DNA endonuclease (very short patch repair protein)